MAFILGMGGLFLSFRESKNNIDTKLVSESSLVASQTKYDSLENEQINLLGGGKILPMFKLFQITPTQFVFFLLDSSKYTMRDFFLLQLQIRKR